MLRQIYAPMDFRAIVNAIFTALGAVIGVFVFSVGSFYPKGLKDVQAWIELMVVEKPSWQIRVFLAICGVFLVACCAVLLKGQWDDLKNSVPNRFLGDRVQRFADH